MHAFFYTQPASRRSFWARRATAPLVQPASRLAAAPSCAPSCLMQMTVDASAITLLRQMVMRICGEAMEFMRIEACDHGTRMKVWLCISRTLVGQVMEAVMRAMPGAEFGRFSERAAARAAQ
jgi:hypothetical protein